MPSNDYDRVERAIRYLERHADSQPSLDSVARHVALSPFHFQRLFKRWAGVSPKRFLQFLTVERAKALLEDSASVLETALGVGLSGPGRLHDLFVSVEAMTPGEFKDQGRGVEIRFGLHPTPFGEALVAVTPRGLCGLSFAPPKGRKVILEELQRAWRGARLVEDPSAGREVIRAIFSCPRGPQKVCRGPNTLLLQLRGTNFQLKVWKALLRIPEGAIVSYSDIAKAIGHPRAVRAVGSAVGANPIGYLIPCHRVLRSSGHIGGYRWGTTRKRAILGRELSTSRPLESKK